jgi:hypothetical protein
MGETNQPPAPPERDLTLLSDQELQEYLDELRQKNIARRGTAIERKPRVKKEKPQKESPKKGIRIEI